jgi:Xaa-Pro aminopeptidase
LFAYRENPPNLTFQHDDILFFDFGPIFEEFEADFGRTYVIGNDAKKLKLKNDVALAWQSAKAFYNTKKETITGAELFDFVAKDAINFGWTFGNEHCGHLIGKYPHEKIEGEHKMNYLCADNHLPLYKIGVDGEILHWILEIHLVDTKEEIGGFYEQILTLDK